MRQLWVLAAAVTLACADDPVQPLPACPLDPFANVVPADTGWRARILAQALSVPSDTSLTAIVGYRDSVTDGDRLTLQEAGATVEYEFTGMPAVSIRLSAGELVTLTAPGGPLSDSRVELAELGVPVCIAARSSYR